MRKLILLFASVAVLLGCNSRDTEELHPELLYLSKVDGDYEIFKNDLNGNELRLTNNKGWDYAPKFNKANEEIIYYSYEGDSFLIKSMTISGEPITRDFYGLIEYNISPDGKLLLFQKQDGDSSALTISKFNGTDEYTIAEGSYYNGRAKWSPDAKKVLYISDRDGNNEVYLYDLATGVTSRLTNNQSNEKYISWAPDNERFVFSTQYYEEGNQDRNDLFIMEINSRVVSQLTQDSFNDVELAWSPKGDLIAFHSNRSGGDHIFLMNVDSKEISQISFRDSYHGEPNWVY